MWFAVCGSKLSPNSGSLDLKAVQKCGAWFCLMIGMMKNLRLSAPTPDKYFIAHYFLSISSYIRQGLMF